MVNILGYQGNAGLGSNPQIPAIGNTDLTSIDNMVRDIMFLDNQRNMTLYQQKIRDRDTMHSMILRGQIPSGDMLPEYMPEFKKAKIASEEAFKKWKGDMNDIDGYTEYISKTSDLNDLAVKAHGNTLSIRQLEIEKSKATLPSKQKQIQDHIDAQKKGGLWGEVKPYQKVYDVNTKTFDDMVKPIAGGTIKDPSNPYQTYSRKYIDFSDILKNAANEFIKGQEGAEDIGQWLEKFQAYDQKELPKSLDAMDRQIDKYNAQRGLKPGMQGYADHIKREVVDGQTLIKEPAINFAAKYALAKQPEFDVRIPDKFNKDQAAFDISKMNADVNRMKANGYLQHLRNMDATSRLKANAYAKHMAAQDKKIADGTDEERVTVIKQYNDFVDNVALGGIRVTDKKTGKQTGTLDAVYVSDLPKSYLNIAGPVQRDSFNKDGTLKSTQMAVGRVIPFISKDNKQYYIPKFVDKISGAKIDPNKMPPEMEQGYQQTKKNLANKVNVTRDDYVKGLLKDGQIELVLTGQDNTAANYTTMYQSAKMMNAKLGKKGVETNITNPPEDEPGDFDPDAGQ